MSEARTCREQSDFERVAVDLSARFINLSSDEIEPGIVSMLGSIGGFFGADRAYIGRFTESHRRFTLTHEWNTPAVGPTARNWIAVPSSMFAEILRSFHRNETVCIPRVARMPNQDARERILASGTRAIMLTPLVYEGTLWGFVGLSSTVEAQDWPEHAPRLLSVFGQMCVSALERKRGEADLRMTRFSVDHSSEAAFWLTSDGRFSYVNDAACRSLGYSQEELLKLTVHDIDPNFPKEAWPDHWARIEREKKTTIESVHRRKDGSEFPVQIRINFHRFEGREYNFAFARDITARREAEHDRLYKKEFERLITRISTRFINISPDGIDSELSQALREVGESAGVDRSYIFRFSPDRKTMKAVAEWTKEGNPAQIHKLQRVPVDEISWWFGKMSRQEVFHASTLDSIPAGEETMLSMLRSVGIRSLVDVPIVRRGEVVGFLGLSTSDREREWSESTISILKILAEITANAFERKQAEEERLRLATAARQTAEAVLITDVDGQIQYVNPAFERTSGRDRDEVVGMTLRDLYGDVEAGALAHNLCARLAESGRWAGRISSRRADGSALEEDVSIVAIHDASGEAIGFVSVGRDVTEQIRMETLLRQSQKMEAIGQLAGGVAHDFNNLLQAMKGYTALAQSVLDPGEKAQAYLAEVEKASDRAGDLVRQLLTFSRHKSLRFEFLCISDVVAGVMKMLRRVIGEHLELQVSTGRTTEFVHADRGQIEQILMNLCVNARDAMPEGGCIRIETGQVEFDQAHSDANRWSRPGRFARLSVSDTGCGIPDEVVDRIFEPFFTTKGVGEGTGLGLATVYAIVERHEGLLQVASEPHGGSVFDVYLPIREPRGDELDGEALADLAAGGTETILLAEDDRQVRTLAAQVLSQAGYRVIEAEDGDEAVRKFRRYENAIDLAVLDVVMPGRSGREVHDLIHRRRPQTSILFSSGYSFQALESGKLPEEGFDIIPKPYKPDVLLRRVREVLESEDRLIG